MYEEHIHKTENGIDDWKLTYEVLTNTKIMLHNKRGGLKPFLFLSPECVRLSCLVGYIFNKTEQQTMNVSTLV